MAAKEIQPIENTGEIVPKPEPVMKGVFSLYETPDGGYHIAYTNERGENPEETHHHQIPGMVVKLAKQASEGGGPFGLMGKMFG